MFALVTLIICFIYIFPLFYCEFAVLCYSYWVILKEMLISLVTLCYRQGRLTVHSSRTGDFHLTPKNSCLGTKPRSISRQWTWIFPEATRGEKINLKGKKNTQMCGMEASSFHSPLFFRSSSSSLIPSFPPFFLRLLFLFFHLPFCYQNTKSGFQRSARVHKVHDDVHLSLLKLGDPSRFRLLLSVFAHLSHGQRTALGGRSFLERRGKLSGGVGERRPSMGHGARLFTLMSQCFISPPISQFQRLCLRVAPCLCGRVGGFWALWGQEIRAEIVPWPQRWVRPRVPPRFEMFPYFTPLSKMATLNLEQILLLLGLRVCGCVGVGRVLGMWGGRGISSGQKSLVEYDCIKTKMGRISPSVCAILFGLSFASSRVSIAMVT